MNKLSFLLLVIFGWTTLHGQVIYEKFKSDKLGETRELKIQLPRTYSKENSIKYPLVIVLDGDYLFEPVIGNIDYQSYWNDMPECIIVGINQEGSRDFDLYFSEITGLPEAEGASFFEFIGMELIPYMEGKYKASNFRIAIGHDKSANFINYYLFKDNPIFKAYMVFSPDLAPEMVNRLSQRLASLEPVTFYYLATSEGDISNLKEDIVAANNVLKSIDNPNLYYTFDNFDDASHYSLVGQGIPRALNSIFELFKPIDAIEYKEEMLTYAGSPMEYLVKKYEDIEAFYGFKKRYVENDLRAVAAAAKKKDDIEAFKELSKLAKQEFPESMISAYYQGLYFELDGNLKRALNYYQSGLLLEPSQFITKDVLLDKIYEMKEERD